MRRFVLAPSAAFAVLTCAPFATTAAADADTALSDSIQAMGEQVCAAQPNDVRRYECPVDFGMFYVYARLSEIRLTATRELIALGAIEEARAGIAKAEEDASFIEWWSNELLVKYGH